MTEILDFMHFLGFLCSDIPVTLSGNNLNTCRHEIPTTIRGTCVISFWIWHRSGIVERIELVHGYLN